MYHKGEGVEKDYKKAMKWFLLSANQGHPKSQKALGIHYIVIDDEEKSL